MTSLRGQRPRLWTLRKPIIVMRHKLTNSSWYWRTTYRVVYRDFIFSPALVCTICNVLCHCRIQCSIHCRWSPSRSRLAASDSACGHVTLRPETEKAGARTWRHRSDNSSRRAATTPRKRVSVRWTVTVRRLWIARRRAALAYLQSLRHPSTTWTSRSDFLISSSRSVSTTVKVTTRTDAAPHRLMLIRYYFQGRTQGRRVVLRNVTPTSGAPYRRPVMFQSTEPRHLRHQQDPWRQWLVTIVAMRE